MGGPGARYLTDEEKANAPKVTKSLLKRIFGYLKPYWFQFILVFVVIIVAAVIGLFPSIITGKIVDEALVGEDLRYLVELLLIALATMLASQVIGVLENYINAWISSRIVFDMKNQMYQHLQYMPHSFFTTEKQGDIITRMNTDISGVSSVISGTLSKAVSAIATVVTSLVALFAMSWQLAIVGVLVIPLLIIPSRSAGKVRLKLLQETQAKNDEMNQIVNETLSVSGSLLVKLFTSEEREYDKFESVNEEVRKLSMRDTRSGAWFNVIMGMFGQLGPLLIYFAGGLLIIKHFDPTLTVGTITAMVALVNRLYRPVESILNLSVTFTRSLAMFTRIFDYLDRKNTITNPENGAKPDVSADSTIRYDHVAFGYDEGRLILKDVDFVVPSGKMYAIVGPSGSGKSTVVNLIPRLYDVNDGSVSVGGVDVREFDLPYLRQCIGTVSQEAYLFNGSILDNLKYAKPDASLDEVIEACKTANIYDFILRQPEGFDTEVGNRGLKLSGGEKQRLSLARVVLKDPKILILDEATSALDSISEQAIQDALEKMMVGRTSIVIAHRLSTILKADRIMVVKDGIIAEQGTHDELLALGGTYHELYETQFRTVIDAETAKGEAKAPAVPAEPLRSEAPQPSLRGSAERLSPAAPAEGASQPPEPRGRFAEMAALREALRAAGVPRLDIQSLGTAYEVRRLTAADIADVYGLARTNRKFYEALGTHLTVDGLTDVITRVPEGAGANAKLFVGFYDPVDDGYQELVAIMDLIMGYPEAKTAFIGWFMVDAALQGQGIGSDIFADVRASMSAQGFTAMELACPAADEGARAFWEAQGFAASGEAYYNGEYDVIRMRRDI